MFLQVHPKCKIGHRSYILCNIRIGILQFRDRLKSYYCPVLLPPQSLNFAYLSLISLKICICTSCNNSASNIIITKWNLKCYPFGLAGRWNVEPTVQMVTPIHIESGVTIRKLAFYFINASPSRSCRYGVESEANVVNAYCNAFFQLYSGSFLP